MTLSDLKTKLRSKHFQEEALVFFIGVLPYWYTVWMPQKTATYWYILSYLCVVWIAYGYRRGAHMTMLNNTVELCIAISGILALSGWLKP